MQSVWINQFLFLSMFILLLVLKVDLFDILIKNINTSCYHVHFIRHTYTIGGKFFVYFYTRFAYEKHKYSYEIAYRYTETNPIIWYSIYIQSEFLWTLFESETNQMRSNMNVRNDSSWVVTEIYTRKTESK